jgi:hypothetical protein
MLTPPLSSGRDPWTSIHVQSDGQDEYWNRENRWVRSHPPFIKNVD